jgi:nucleoside-diphosphate-sugar epimerase
LKKVLLTGANGFLGKYICDHLKKEGVKIYTLGRSKEMDFSVDLANELPSFDTVFDLVIHSAAKAHFVPRNHKEVKALFNINVKGTQNLLHALEHSGAPDRFVFISSVSVYGLSNGTLIDENTPLLASDPYGLSKIKGEELVSVWCNTYNVKGTILRLPLVFGDNPPGNLGKMIKAIKKGYYFNINNNTAKKSIVFAEDVARFITAISKIGGTYNLTDGYHPDFFELSGSIAKRFNKRVPKILPSWIVIVIAKIGDLIGKKSIFNSAQYLKIVSSLTFDDRKARDTFRWNSRSVLDILNKK